MRKNIPTDSKELTMELDDQGILFITMCRPEVHNAFDDYQIARFIKALNYAEQEEAVKVLVIGSEGRSFSAGGDLNYMKRMGQNTYEENYEDAQQLAQLMKQLNFFPKPTIARVQGAAFGGGVGLICCCDMAIGTQYAKLALSEVKVGMVPATIGPYVIRAIGERNARRLFLTGEIVRSEEALRLGYLSQLVDAAVLDETVQAVAAQLIKNSPNAVRTAKELIFNIADGEVDEKMIDYTVKMIANIRDSKEGREGLAAFLEKRPPKW